MADCTYTVGDKDASGDNYYAPFLNDEQRTYFWNTYGFHGNKDSWTGGWGWDDDANTDKPLARAFHACWVLTYAAVDYPNDEYGTNNILNWARRYVRNKMDDLQARCGSNPFAIATTFTGPFTDDRTELYLSFFYDNSVVERTAVLVHESRHYDVGHDANFPSWSVLANAGQGQQADSSWDHNGAYQYEVAYLSWFHNVAPAAPPAMRARARQRANWCLDNAFAAHPGFSIDESSAPQSGWRWCGKCQCLCFAGFGQIGRCAAGGQHEHGGSWDFAMLPGGTNAGTQRGWRWCDKCQGIAFAPNGGGVCPAGGAHHFTAGDYSLPALPNDVYPASQSEWRWCSKCQGLHFAPNGGGVCPAGGKHNAQSWNYTLFLDASGAGQTGWRWCRKCQGMAYGAGAAGACPAGGHHDHSGSGGYVMAHDAPHMGQEGWCWCSKCQGLNYALNGPGVCPAGGGHQHQSWAYGLAFTT